MSIFDKIFDQYSIIDSDYATKEFNALQKNHNRKADKIKEKRELLTHAYFLFMFTRLEDHIKKESKKLIIKRKTSIINWKTRAIWEIPDTDRLYFKKRLSLLTEEGGSVYNRIIEYYDYRNKIAHGNSIPNINSEILMNDVLVEFSSYMNTLRR